MLLVLVKERLDSLVLLERRQLRRIGELKEGGRVLDQPFRVDRGHLSHVFLCRLNDLVIDHPLGLTVEQ